MPKKTNVQRLKDEALIDPDVALAQNVSDVINALTPNEVEELLSLKRHFKAAGADVRPLGKGEETVEAVVIL
jgi:hypothetical protein